MTVERPLAWLLAVIAGALSIVAYVTRATPSPEVVLAALGVVVALPFLFALGGLLLDRGD